MSRRWSVVIGIIVGGLLAALVVVQAGIHNVLLLMERGGAKLILVLPIHAAQIVFTGLAWWTLMRCRSDSPPLRFFVFLRWLREGVSSLVPSVQIGGLLVVVRLLCRAGQSFGVAAAGVIADSSVEMGTQVAFTLLGLWALKDITGGTGLGAAAISGFLLLAGLAAAAIAAQGLGGAKLAERLAGRFGWQAVSGLHDAIWTIYRNRRAVGLAACWHLLAWLMGSIEVVAVFHFFGRDVGLRTGLVVESLGQVVKTAGFAVPGALGIQEGGYVLVCGLLGLSSDLALALSLTKRLRDLAFGLPSTALWLRLEHKHALAKQAGRSATEMEPG